MNLSFSGNSALILGGSSEAALAAARCMLESGIKPILSYRDSIGLEKIQTEFILELDSIETVLLDFNDPETLAYLEGGAAESPDFLVDFAQEDFERYVCSARTQDIYSFFQANVAFRASVLKRIGRGMLQRKKGRCVFISSAAASRTNPGQGFYAAAKLASEALYKNLGTELGSRGVTAVVLRPGYIDAGRGRRYLGNNKEHVLAKIPTKRALTSREVAENVLFLLSDTASGFNAVDLVLDGGLTAKKT
ncbi:SDR family NAD(P)-dependent oxidoreductase [Desulfovermiculus halophilus]|jgi:3-oxoacyl-[acyl-carrier protein] reductase|uniref:SDR family NAD(P)-dependent oxidoreductase n=1 Tax=Desulfovermiculus halophilus TaxID=339722 RepID=UPI000480B62F|nr:SDR family oxidoreductase [Desulfovermiculus halophilus]